jgi:hypothetical protein
LKNKIAGSSLIAYSFAISYSDSISITKKFAEFLKPNASSSNTIATFWQLAFQSVLKL